MEVLPLKQLITSAWKTSRERATPQPFNFVTVTDPKNIKSRGIQHRIRRHAGLSGVRKRSNKARPTTWSFELKTINPGTSTTTTWEDHYSDRESLPYTHPEANTSPKVSSAGITTSENLQIHQDQNWILSDPHAVTSPFYGFTVLADERSRLLFDFFVDFKSRCTYPFSPLCFSFALWDEGVISLVLASASSLYRKETGRSNDDGTESKRYMAVGLRSLNSRLQNPVDSTSDAVIFAIVALTCQGLFEEKFSGWEMHMRGLKQILDLRGGLKSLSSANMLRLALSLIDINGGLALDAKPFFEMARYVPERPRRTVLSPFLDSLVRSLLSSSEGTFDASCDALISVATLSDYINEQSHQSGFFKDDSIRANCFFPVLSEVLHLTRPDGKSDNIKSSLQQMKEAIRLTLLLYTALLKERFYIAPSCIDRRSIELCRFLTVVAPESDDYLFLSLWLWIHATLAVTTKGERRRWAIAKISTLMQQLGIVRWFNAVAIIKGIAWVDQMSGEGLTVLGLEVHEYQSHYSKLRRNW